MALAREAAEVQGRQERKAEAVAGATSAVVEGLPAVVAVVREKEAGLEVLGVAVLRVARQAAVGYKAALRVAEEVPQGRAAAVSKATAAAEAVEVALRERVAVVAAAAVRELTVVETALVVVVRGKAEAATDPV